MWAVSSEPLQVVWIFYDCKATDLKPFIVPKLIRRLRKLVWVYTRKNVTLLEITCRGYFVVNPFKKKCKRQIIQHSILLLMRPSPYVVNSSSQFYASSFEHLQVLRSGLKMCLVLRYNPQIYFGHFFTSCTKPCYSTMNGFKVFCVGSLSNSFMPISLILYLCFGHELSHFYC